jgi:sensor histidine kinase YesM
MNHIARILDRRTAHPEGVPEHDPDRLEALRILQRLRPHLPWMALLGLAGTALIATWALPSMGGVSFVVAWLGLSFLLSGLVLVSINAWLSPAEGVAPTWTRHALGLLVVSVLGAGCGALVTAWLSGRDPLRIFAERGEAILFYAAVVGALVFATQFGVTAVRLRRYRSRVLRLEREARELELKRQLAEARLSVLQAQIEPHFLFNTLGSVQQLAEGKAPEAAALVAQLIRFLRAAMPRLREESTTLESEAELAHAYLAIMRTRLGARLDYGIDIPPELASFRLPPAMLITLVENAVKHGIEPAREGGRITVSASRYASRIVVTVADTGAGLGSSPGDGVGLSNLRERLFAFYGERARLVLAQNAPCGFLARLELPDERD